MGDTKENASKSTNYDFVIELIEGQKKEKKFYKIMIFVLLGIILVQGGFSFAQGLYHNYKWSEFDTIVVDGGEGGDANYIGNDGDINNYGENSSSPEKKPE